MTEPARFEFTLQSYCISYSSVDHIVQYSLYQSDPEICGCVSLRAPTYRWVRTGICLYHRSDGGTYLARWTVPYGQDHERCFVARRPIPVFRNNENRQKVSTEGAIDGHDPRRSILTFVANSRSVNEQDESIPYHTLLFFCPHYHIGIAQEQHN